MIKKVQIRNYNLPKSPRVFDVTVNEKGNILRYDVQNIVGCIYVDMVDVKRQIQEALKK